MKVEVIKPDHTQAPDLIAWVWAAHKQLCVEDGTPFNPEASPDMLIEAWVAGGVLVVMAFDDNEQPTGCAVYTINRSLVGYVVAVGFTVWIRPTWRGKGISKQMMALAKQTLVGLKVDLWISACDGNSPLRKVHEANGLVFSKLIGVGRL